VGRLALALLLAAGLGVIRALPAGAHAELLSTVPASDATLAQSPTEVRLRFSEEVSVTPTSIRVFDANRKRVDRGGAENAAGNDHEVRLTLPDLADGGYVVAWRVVSADSHPIQGAFDFRVGSGGRSADPGLVGEVLDSTGGDRAVGVTFGAVRAITYAALALLLGGGLFLAWVWPGGRHVRPARVAWYLGWAGTAVGTIAQVGLEGVYGAGLPLSGLRHWSVWEDVLATRYGLWASARLGVLGVAGLLCVAAGAARMLRAHRLNPLLATAGAVIGVALAATVSLAGHASSGRWVAAALVADVVHVVAASAWLGGLAVALGVVML
jgi:copper transport protein